MCIASLRSDSDAGMLLVRTSKAVNEYNYVAKRPIRRAGRS